MYAMESSRLPPEPAAPAPQGSPSPDDSGLIPLRARLEPEVHKYLKIVSETEGISLNSALNLTVSRYHHYPKDLAEVHRVLTYLQGQLELISDQMKLAEVHEARLVDLIEGGEVERRLEEIRDREEAELEASEPPRPNPSAPPGA